MPPHHQVFSNVTGNKSKTEIGEYLSKLGDILKKNKNIILSGKEVKMPAKNTFTIRHERRARGETVLIMEIEWDDYNENSEESTFNIESSD